MQQRKLLAMVSQPKVPNGNPSKRQVHTLPKNITDN